MKKTIFITVAALLLTIGIAKAITLNVDELKELLGGAPQNSQEELGVAVLSGDPFDVVGTKVGTTTTGVYFYALDYGTTTYPIMIDPLASEGIFTIKPMDFSSSTAALYLSLIASNDTSCDTATTSTSYANTITTKQINWFDAGNYLLGATQASALTQGTTTVAYNLTDKRTNEMIFLQNLNSRCLGLQVSGTSTAVWIQFKQNSKP